MLFVGLQYVVLEVWKQRTDPGIHHLILDVGVHREQFDDLPNDLGFLLDRLVTAAWNLPNRLRISL
jgi:hypothetical protein